MQTPNIPLTIPIHKTKVILMLLGSLCFVACGCWMWTSADTQTKESPLFLKVLAAACILFFSTTFLFGIIVILRKQYGLIIDDKGITDNSTIYKERFIPWAAITGLGVMQIGRTRILLIKVREPELFIDCERGWKRGLLMQSYRSYGTPVSLTANILKINVDNLSALIQERMVLPAP